MNADARGCSAPLIGVHRRFPTLEDSPRRYFLGTCISFSSQPGPPLLSLPESNDQLALADDVALNKAQQARLVQSGRERETRVKGVYRKAVVVLLIRLRIRTVISRTFTFEIRDALNDPGKFCRSMNNLITW